MGLINKTERKMNQELIDKLNEAKALAGGNLEIEAKINEAVSIASQPDPPHTGG